MVVARSFVVLAFCSSAAAAQVHPVPTPVTHAVERRGDIRIDGRIDEAAWAAAAPVTQFTQTDPREGQPASQRTEIRFLYDGAALYVGARMYDSLGARGVSARLTRRDRREASDYLEILLDTYHDHLGRASFTVNPLGVRSDALAAGGGDEDDSWDPIWEAAAHIDSLGWTAEMRIPFSQLRFSRDEQQTWGLLINRFINRLNESDRSAFWTKRENGGPSRFGHLEGIRVVDRPGHAEVLPYVVQRARYIKPSAPGDPFNDGSRLDVRAGGDVKYLLTSNLTLDATFNPDFGQVEVDPAVVNLSAFETFYPEKRPFFVEGAGIFDFASQSCFFCVNTSGLESFYSRRIGRAPQLNGVYDGQGDYTDLPENSTILGAGKVTGRTAGGYSLGVLAAVTRRETATLVDAGSRFRHEVEPLSNYLVSRIKRDLRGGDLVIGAIGTSVFRETSDSTARARLSRHAEMGGVDLDAHWKRKQYHLLASAAMSNVAGDALSILRLQRSSARYFQRPDRSVQDNGLFSSRLDSALTRLGGYGAYARLAKESGDWTWEGSANVRSPGYEVNDIGFIRSADYQQLQGNVLRQWTRPTALYRSWVFGLGGMASRNFGGDVTDGYGVLGYSGTFANYWNSSGFLLRLPEVFDDRATRGGPTVKRPANTSVFANVRTDSRQRVVLSFGPSFKFPDNELGSITISLDANVKAASNLTVSVGGFAAREGNSQQYVTSVPDPVAAAFYGTRYIFSDLNQKTVGITTRVNWTFTPLLTLELYAQPFASSVDYTSLKEFNQPRSLAKSVYGVDRGTITPLRDALGRDTTYRIDPDGAGPARSFTVDNPDFSFRALRGNAVLRWEYRPGSTLFLVWTQSRSGDSTDGTFSFDRERSALFREHPDNVFLLKVNYWLGR